MYEKALSIYLKKLGNDHPHVALTCNNMANVYMSEGKYDEPWTSTKDRKTLKIRKAKLETNTQDEADNGIIAQVEANIVVSSQLVCTLYTKF